MNCLLTTAGNWYLLLAVVRNQYIVTEDTLHSMTQERSQIHRLVKRLWISVTMDSHNVYHLGEFIQVLLVQRNLGKVFLHTLNRSASWNREHGIIRYLRLRSNPSNRNLRHRVTRFPRNLLNHLD